MIPGIITRCAIGAILLLAFSSSALSARVLRAPGGGAVRALLVGIDKYPNLNKASELNGAVADVHDLSAAIKSAGVPDVNVRVLTDADAVRSRFVAEMKGLVDNSKQGDLAIIAYSGHGMRAGRYKQWDEPTHAQIVMSAFGHDAKNGHEIIVDAEMRAWYARLEAKGVDTLVVMDSCYGGGMRAVHPWAQAIKVRALTPGAGESSIDDRLRDSFQSIPMTGAEIRADVNDMLHLSFFAGAQDDSTVPELAGIDPANRAAVRGALSYFLARTIDGKLPQGGALPAGGVTRAQLFGFLQPNVLAASEGRQFMDFRPQKDADNVMQRVVFRIEDEGAPGTQHGGEGKPAPAGPVQITPVAAHGEPVRVAITNGPAALFSTIEKGRAPFVQSDPANADLIWDVGHAAALSRGDIIMDRVDATILGPVIDRTYAVREIQKLAVARIIKVEIGEKGRAYGIGEAPTLAVSGIRGSYLTVVNVAADGKIQMLFPPQKAEYMAEDTWSRNPRVDLPLGADYAVAIATSAPADDLIHWLRAHNNKRDAFALPSLLAGKINADRGTRLGTAGLFTN